MNTMNFFKKSCPSLSAIHKHKLLNLTWEKRTKTIKLLRSGITKLPCFFHNLVCLFSDICHPKNWLLAIAPQGFHTDTESCSGCTDNSLHAGTQNTLSLQLSSENSNYMKSAIWPGGRSIYPHQLFS